MTKSFLGVMTAEFSGVSDTYVLSVSSVRAEMSCGREISQKSPDKDLTHLGGLVLGGRDEICPVGRPLQIVHLQIRLVRLYTDELLPGLGGGGEELR